MKPSTLMKKFKLCKGVYARNAKGREVSPLSPKAVALCIDGALQRAAKGDNASYSRLAERLRSINEGYIGFNDLSTTTKKDIIDLLKKAGL